MRYAAARDKKVRMLRFYDLKVRTGSHGGNCHLHGAVERLLVEAGGFVNNAADDHRVDGGTAASTSTTTSTESVGGR
jgi:hypothetical protein